MEIRQQKYLTNNQAADLLSIWNAEYPAHLRHLHIDNLNDYLKSLRHVRHYVATTNNGEMAGWLIAFTRENERWFALLIHRSQQKTGLGSLLLKTVKENETVLNAWVIDHTRDTKEDGSSYISPIPFYLKNGFEILKDFRLEKGQLSSVKIRWSHNFH